jgi:ribokinase
MDSDASDRRRSDRPDVAVVGSANLDVVLRVGTLPTPGQTVLAVGSALGPGGKGVNQAVAAARLGTRVSLVAAMGGDSARVALLRELEAAGVDTTSVRTSPSRTGSAYVIVDDAGENQIVVDAGANADLRDLQLHELELLAASRVVLCQLEVPIDTVVAAVEHGRASGAITIVNAAPAARLPDALTSALDVLVVNATEAREVGDRATTVEEALTALVARVPTVIVTLGAGGAVVATRAAGIVEVPAVAARSVLDTTGAGDTFCGALAAAIARGQQSVEATRWGCVAASLSVERAGAASSAPTAVQIEERLAELGGELCG